MHSIAAGRKIPSSLSTQTSKVLEEMMIGVNRVMAEEHLLLEYGAKLVRYLLCAIVWRKVSHISWHVLQCNRRGKSHRGSINSLSLLLLCNLMFYSQVKDPLLLLRRLPLFKTYSVHASVKQQQQLKQPLSRVLNTRWNSCWNCRERIFRSDKQPSLHRKVIIANSTLAVVVQHVDSLESLGVMNGRIAKRLGQMIIAQGNDLHVRVIVISTMSSFSKDAWMEWENFWTTAAHW